MFEGAEELRHDGAGLALREGHDPREEVEELPVGAELEDEEDDGLAHEDVVQLYDVPVAVDVLQDVGLAKELVTQRQPIFVSESSAPFEDFLFGAVHDLD